MCPCRALLPAQACSVNDSSSPAFLDADRHKLAWASLYFPAQCVKRKQEFYDTFMVYLIIEIITFWFDSMYVYIYI